MRNLEKGLELERPGPNKQLTSCEESLDHYLPQIVEKLLTDSYRDLPSRPVIYAIAVEILGSMDIERRTIREIRGENVVSGERELFTSLNQAERIISEQWWKKFEQCEERESLQHSHDEYMAVIKEKLLPFMFCYFAKITEGYKKENDPVQLCIKNYRKKMGFEENQL